MARDPTGHTRRMKRIATFVALAALTTAAAAVALADAGGASTRTATLRLADTTPVTVAGARFLARESVVVRATIDGERLTRRTRASAAGRFTTTFTGHDLNDRCNSDLRVTATGARGSEAVLKIGPQPQCPPRLRTP
jgi:hypothetical protein